MIKKQKNVNTVCTPKIYLSSVFVGNKQVNVIKYVLTISLVWNIMYAVQSLILIKLLLKSLTYTPMQNGGQTIMLNKVMELLAKQLRIDVDTLDPETNIVEDLGADSLDIVEMLMAIEENFGITVSDEEAMTLKTIRDVADFIEKKI
jgi:acyl carrier protein